MKTYKALTVMVMVLASAIAAQAEDKSGRGSYEAKIKAMEERFFAAREAGRTIKGVIVEGNSLFNGTTSPQTMPWGKPYAKEDILPAKISAERNSQIFILAKDGTLYYPTPRKGEHITESTNSPRIPRVLTDEQKRGPKMFTWSTLVPLVGRQVEICGEVYPGYAGVKGIHIESMFFEGEYIVGK